ncbi:MAG: dTDP-glucose 4,6-dehydratase [Pelotomaculum sp.]|uniref:dTDP-glucose 4,6-dehydratase n=1 Tax=Pelotomaculum thermopropionicum (strain DSM 13744 / JCM 10971 / SI) TaxID=370438 RepID=A5D3A1_PELTS|nr:dTDP-glucose 4,6-dehydratase [Pelotomaculum sp.]BAF59262.1 dTDP-D-glucose 4,6-dehydratase [Pelotomaculum thermopropionicum SI]
MKLLVTGGAGFIGSNFIHFIHRKHWDWQIVNLDKLTYAGNLKNLEGLDVDRHRFVRGDIADPDVVNELAGERPDAIVNFAAESHVDRSISNPSPFIDSNVKGVQVLLEAARRFGIKKFIQVSTDEVYGSLGPDGAFNENSPLAPNSPYSASKAAADLLCRAYYKTYHLPVIVTRCSNNFGPRQYPEKFIPVVITCALANRPVPVYGDGLNVRDWLYVADHCRALEAVILAGRAGEVYNIGGGRELTNLELAGEILRLLGKPASLIRFVADRPGHDRRYAVDSSKIRRELGWRPVCEFEKALGETVRWYAASRGWWDHAGVPGE